MHGRQGTASFWVLRKLADRGTQWGSLRGVADALTALEPRYGVARRVFRNAKVVVKHEGGVAKYELYRPRAAAEVVHDRLCMAHFIDMAERAVAGYEALRGTAPLVSQRERGGPRRHGKGG